MKDFSEIAGPLTRLNEKQVKFNWDENSETSFQELKKRLMTALILDCHRILKILLYILMFHEKDWDAC